MPTVTAPLAPPLPVATPAANQPAAAPSVGAALPVIQPTTQPTALGIPNADFLDTFRGEACADTPVSYRIPLLSGEADAVQILRILNKLQSDYAANGCVQEFAQCLTRNITMDNAVRQQISAVVNFVLGYMVYQADPVDVEWVRSPVQLLRQFQSQGYGRGDCDDLVLLTNSLLGALGIKTRAIALKVNGATVWNHVISQIANASTWVDFDPCNKGQPWGVLPGDRLILS